MNKDEFYSFLSKPTLLSNISEIDIDDIITEYPYFQTAYILKAKILSDKKSIKFDNQIKTTSLYALDRKVLYEYIHINTQNIEDSNQKIVKEKIAEQKFEDEERVKSKEETTKEYKHTDKLEQVEKRKIYFVKLKIKAEVKKVPEKPKKEIKEQIVEKNKISNNKSIADIILEKLKDKKKKPGCESIADIILRKAKQKEEKQIVKTKAISKQKEAVETKQEIKEKRKIYFVKIKEEYFATSTKEAVKEEKKKAKKVDNIIIPELDEILEKPITDYVEIIKKPQKEKLKENMNFSDWLNFVENREKTPKKDKKHSLINKFISENPSISIKIDDISETQKEEKPIEESTKNNFVTETLANIYIKQKHYNKAISVMEKLSLKYPQKSSYFANRINEIKNLIKE